MHAVNAECHCKILNFLHGTNELHIPVLLNLVMWIPQLYVKIVDLLIILWKKNLICGN